MNFSNIAKELSNSNLSKVINVSQQNREAEILFSINMNKEEIYRNKKAIFSNTEFKKIFIIYNSTNYGHVSNYINDVEIIKFELEKFKSADTNELSVLFQDSIIIMTNNLFAQIGIEKLSSIYERLPNSVWVIQDYDNHHWIENSIQASIFADIYFPAHMDGEISLLTKINPNVPCFLPCGSNQWSRSFIDAHQDNLIKVSRQSEPLGKYYFYEKFIHRNKIINSLNKLYKNIGIVGNDFHQLSENEKWNEWISHRYHWIIPTANDLPIRFFDALITGGIPIIPKTLIPYIKLLEIPEDFYKTFTSLDILEPNNLINYLNEKSSLNSSESIIERHQFALKHFHIDAIISKAIDTTMQYYCV